jgi:hypothetical protein
LHLLLKTSTMKKSIASRIEKLLASMAGSDLSQNSKKTTKSRPESRFSGSNIGKFCRQIPISLFNLIRPAPKLNIPQNGKM